MQTGLSYPDSTGKPEATFELTPDYTGCAYPDPDHSYQGRRTEYADGMMNGFLQVQPGSRFPIGYYQEKDLPFRSAFARNYLTCDHYFPSILAPTFPNRIVQHAGQTDRLGDTLSICTLPTIWDRLAAAGIGHKYYFNNVPFVALWGLST
jgi:phospholipase C